MKKFFGTDGVRGIANKDLTNKLSYNLARGLANELLLKGIKRPKIIIGKDTRISSDMLEAAIIAGLLSMGCDVTEIGVVPTPALSHLTILEKFDAGIMLSASHNSYEYNGIKIFNSEGHKLSDEKEEELEKYITKEKEIDFNFEAEKLGRVVYDDKLINKYVKELKKYFKKLDLKGKNIFIDASNGSNYDIAEKVFKSFNANVTMFNNKPDGVNINVECGSIHPEFLQKEMRKKDNKNKVDLGIIFDGDGDRLIVIDDKAKIANGDIIMSVVGQDLVENKKMTKDIVFTVMTNCGIINGLKEKGFNVYQTKVGDKYVYEKMVEKDLVYGGEQAGHIIYRNIKSTGDGIQSALLLLQAMQNTGKKLSELRKDLKEYPQVLINAIVNKDRKMDFMKIDAINKKIEKIEKKIDGKGRILVRPSGTEPLIRVMIEGENLEEITKWAQEIADMYEKQLY